MKQGFYETRKWRELRYKTLRAQGFKCCACGAFGEGVILHVDHIKPRSTHPQLELDPLNLQVLCEDCNLGKSNAYEDDLRDERFDTADEIRTRQRNDKILADLPHTANTLGLSEMEIANVRNAIERENTAMTLKARARRLAKHLPRGSWSLEAVERIACDGGTEGA